MKLFNAEHDDDDTDDKPFFKRSEVVHQEFKYPPHVPEEFIPTKDLPPRSHKGKEVAAGSRDPRASKKTIPSPAQQPDEPAAPVNESTAVSSPTRVPHVGDAFADSQDNESSDLSTSRSSADVSPVRPSPSIPLTNVEGPSSPSHRASSPPPHPFKFGEVGQPQEEDMDVDESGKSADELHNAMENLRTQCKCLILF